MTVESKSLLIEVNSLTFESYCSLFIEAYIAGVIGEGEEEREKVREENGVWGVSPFFSHFFSFLSSLPDYTCYADQAYDSTGMKTVKWNGMK